MIFEMLDVAEKYWVKTSEQKECGDLFIFGREIILEHTYWPSAP